MTKTTDTFGDEFVLLEGLPERRKHSPTSPQSGNEVNLSLDCISENQALLTITPPLQPDNSSTEHTPCDIVLVVDVSGSMNAAAQLPDQVGQTTKEESGLSILDLVKHACRMILSKLNEKDRLAVVTFSNRAKVISGLIPMTEAGKSETWRRVEEQKVHDSTNLWAGIKEGLDVLEKTQYIGNTQAMFVLTDGAPNLCCPAQGYVRKLLPILQRMRTENGIGPSISTFGFGCYLRSDLLRSIAEIGKGTYAYIADAGMIGTCFVHAVANVFSISATGVELQLKCSDRSTKVKLESYFELDATDADQHTRMYRIGDLQYGQTRHLLIEAQGKTSNCSLTATLTYRKPGRAPVTSLAKGVFGNKTTRLTRAEVDYQVVRHQLCTFLSGLCGKNINDEFTTLQSAVIPDLVTELDSLEGNIKSRLEVMKKSDGKSSSVANLQALLNDIASENAAIGGQIRLALNTYVPPTPRPPPAPSAWQYRPTKPSYYDKWGKHYLPSIFHAHTRELCLTFKDPGPLRYGIDSPLFKRVRDELDDAFESLPAPKGSLKRRNEYDHHPLGLDFDGTGYKNSTSVNMRRFHSVGNPCFAGDCLIRLGDGESTRVGDLQVGSLAWTPKGARKIGAIVTTDVGDYGGQEMMCVYGQSMNQPLSITPWHPVLIDGQWCFPASLRGPGTRSTRMETGVIYSIMLEKDNDIDAHAIEVGGIPCVTLGHGISSTSAEMEDVRAHAFFGNYDAVFASLTHLDEDKYGRKICGGIMRDKEAGTFGFMRPSERVAVSLRPHVRAQL